MAQNLVKKVVFPQFPQLQTDDSEMMRLHEHLRAIALWSKSFENVVDESLGALDTGGISNVKEIIELISGTPQDGWIITYDNTGPTLNWTDPNPFFINLVDGTPGDGQIPKYESGRVVWRDDEVGSPGSGEANVQVDFNVTDTSADAYILNNPYVYVDGNGVPAMEPPRAGAFAIDNAGHVFPTITHHVIHTVPSTWTVLDLTFGQPERFWRGVDPDAATRTANDGNFYYDTPHDTFVQRRNNAWEPTHWGYAWQYIAGVDTDIDYRQSIYLGQFRTAALARAAMDANAAAVAAYSSGTPAENLRAYWIDTRRDTLVQVTAYTATSSTVDNNLTWGERLVNQTDVENLIDALAPPLTAERLDAIIETPAAFGLIHTVNTTPDPHTLQFGLSTATIARLVATGGTAGQVYTKTSTGHDWADIPAVDYDDLLNKPTLFSGDYNDLTNKPTIPTPITTFLGLTDTPAAFGTAGQAVLVNSAGDGLVFGNVSTMGGAQTILDLTDTPMDYGHAGQYLHLNAAANALVWTTIPETESWARVGVPDLIPLSKLPPISATKVIFPDMTSGELRPGTAADWNATHGYSEVIGWSGDDWMMIDQVAIPKSATFTRQVNGDFFATNLRYRGETGTESNISSPQNGDLYYNFNIGQFRYYSSGTWTTVAHNAPEIAIANIISGTNYAGQSSALAAVSANGQRVLYGGRLYEVSDFVAAATTYPWVNVERPVPWAGSFDVTLAVAESSRSNRGRIAIDTSQDTIYLYFQTWRTTDNPIQGVNHLPVGAFVGIRQGDNTLVLRVLSAFDDSLGTENPTQGGYEVEIYHDASLTYLGASAELLVTAPSGYINFGYTSNTRTLRATLLTGDSTDVVLPNLLAFDVLDDELFVPLAGQIILEQDYDRLFLIHNTSGITDVYSSEIEDEFSSNQYITIPFAHGAGDSSKWFRGDGALADPPSITREQFQDGLAQNFNVSGPGLQIVYDDPGNRFTLASRIENWAVNTNTNRIPISRMNLALLAGVNKFMVEHPWIPFGILASDVSIGSNTITLTSAASFTPTAPDHFMIDDEIMGFSAISADMMTLTVSRGQQLTTEAAHSAGAQVFFRDRSTFQLALQFNNPDGDAGMERIVPLPFQTQKQVHDAVWPQALATNTSPWPATKVGAGTPDGTKYLLDTGAWSPLPPPGSHTEPWALLANPTTRIPVGKLGSGTPGTNTFLRGDGSWQSVATSPDLYKVDNSNVAFSTEGSRRRVNLTVTGANNNAGTTLIFQYYEDPTAVSDMEIEVGVNGANYVRIKWDNPRGGGLENLRLSNIDQFSYLMLYRAGSFWHLIGGTVTEHAAAWAQSGNTGVIPPVKFAPTPAATQVLRVNSTGSALEWFTLPPVGISQADADNRYLRLTGGSLTGALHVTHATGRVLDVTATGTAQSTAAQRLTLGLGRDKAFSIRSTGGAAVDNEWFWIDRNIDGGTTGRAGIGIGHAGVGSETTPDTILFRSNANEWTTPDRFIADEFRVGGTLATTQDNLGIHTWARTADANAIPVSKLGNIANWAYFPSTGMIPPSKLGAVGAGQTVPTDGYYLTAVTTGGSTVMAWLPVPQQSGGMYPGDDHVKDIIGAFVTAASPVGWTYDTTAKTVALTSAGRTEDQVNTQIEARRDFEWCSVTTTINNLSYTLNIDGEGDTAAPTTRILAINFIGALNFVPQRPDSLPVRASYNGMNAGAVMLIGADGNARAMNLGDLRQYGNTNVIHMFRRRSGSNWDWMGTSGAASGTQDVAALVYDWARTGNTDALPTSKIPNIDASKTTSGAFHTDRLTNAVTAARIIAEVGGTVGNNRVIGYDTNNAGLRWYDLPTGGGMADGVVDTVALSLSGQDLTLTLGRTNNLADISDTITLPAGMGTDTNDYVDSVDLSLSGQELTITLGRTGSLADLSDNITLPSGGGSGDITAVNTSNVSGLAGGSTSGAVNLVTNWERLRQFDSSSEDSSAGDDLLNMYIDDDGGQLKMSVSQFISEYNLGGGTGDDAFDWATVGNTDAIPVGKLGNVHSWARDGNTDRLPEAKMTGYPTLFTISSDGPLSMGWTMQRQGLTALTAGSVSVPGVPNDITHSFSGNVLTLNIGRQGSASTLRETIDFSGIGSGSGLTAEQVRDTIAAFAVAGDNMHIVHRDADDELIFSANPPVEFTVALFINSNWGVFAVNVDNPEVSYRVGTLTGVPSSLFQGATWHEDTFYAITQHAANNGLWTINLDTLVATQVSGSIPSNLQDARGIASHNGTMYVAMSAGTSRGLWRINLGDLSASTRIGGWPSGVTGNIRDLFSYDGNLYMIMANRDLWELDTAAPLNSTNVGTFAGSSTDLGPFIEVQGQPYFHEDDGLRLADLGALTLTDLGDFPGDFGVIQAGTHVTTGLSTTFIREGSRPYYSDALVDTWADSNFNGRWDDRLNTVMAPSGEPTVIAEKIDVHGTVYGLRNTFSVDTPGDLPAPGVLTRGQAYFVGSNQTLYWGYREHHLPTPASGDFNTLSSRSDLHVVTAQPGNLNAYDVGDFLFINSANWRIGGGTFSKVVSVSGTKQLQDTTPGEALADWKTSTGQDVEFLGREANSTDALEFVHSVDSGKDYFWFDTTAGAFKILDQSTYMAPTGAVDHDRLFPIAGPGTTGGANTFLDLTDTPGSYGNAGQYVKLNAAADELEFASIPAFESWAAEGNTDRIPTSKLGTGTAGSTNYLRGDGVWASINFISQTTADGRYARLANANTFTARQTIDVDGEGLIVDARGYTGNSPAFGVRVGASGDQKAFQLHKGTDNFAWGSFEFNIGGSDKPGLAFGPGGSSSRDTNLYRDEANVLKTDDTFDADAFRQDGDALNFTHLAGTVQSDQLLTDNTLEFDSDTLGVAVHHVIEKLQEHIRHTASSVSYSTKGATVGHVYNTGPYDYRVTHVRVNMDAPATGITCRARIYTLVDNSNEIDEKIADSASREFSERGEFHYLYFSHDGVIVPSNRRVLVCISRTDQSNDSAVFLSVGSEASDSPEKSYNSAHLDWERVGWAEYEHREPASGNGTRTHDTSGSSDVYGDLEIYYSLSIDHGSLLGDGIDAGDITSGRLDEDRMPDSYDDKPEFNTAVNVNLNVTTVARWLATGLTGWADKTVILINVGAPTSTGSEHVPGFFVFVADIMALTAGTVGETTVGHRYEIEINDPRSTSARIIVFLGRTSSNELLFTTADASDDAYPFRAIAL